MSHQQDIYRKGSRIGVLLIHGLAGTPKEMDSVGMRLNKYGFTVSIPVLPGHCGDTADLLSKNRNDWFAGAEEAYHKLAQETDVVFAGGLSAGAVMSIRLANKYPAVRGIALYSTTLKWDGWSIPRLVFLMPLLLQIPYFLNRYHFAEAFPYGLKNENLRNRIIAKLESGDSSAAGHTDTPAYVLREMMRLANETKRIMPAVKTPALVVHSEEDDIVSFKNNGQYVFDHMGGPKEMLRMKESYHLVTVDQERQKVAQATARFFSDLLDDEERRELESAARKVRGKTEPELNPMPPQ